MKKITLIISAMILFSCGGGNDKSNTKTVTEYELVPKDTMTKPEDGGYGFENIAESMGFETYTFTEEDYKYFGHPDAEKGGNLKFTTSRFPATFRVLGQHYNYTENYYIIGALCYES